jgi:MurNAc alpha-1-phosphate uridylyltransferase
MKIDTALILCAGLGKRLNPLTLETPKPLLELNNITLLETSINMIIGLGVKKILINTFHLRDKISNFIKDKNFPIKIEIIDDGKNILNTGGGIANMIQYSKSDNFLIFNPDTIWNKQYVDEINKMKDFYFENKLSNVLLVVKKELSFDQNLLGNFKLEKNLLKKNHNKNFIYIGCQILNKNLFNNYKIRNFSINEIWDKLLKEKNLNGYESLNKFYHLTDLKIFKKLSKI